jgi:3-oxoacyl-[acyl-carrier protein] reductase
MSEQLSSRQLQGRVAVVTGGGRGIGRAIALRFAEAGARVVIGTRTESAGRAVLEEIHATGGSAELVVCDIGFKSEAVALIEQAEKLFGGIDILVHNAGVFPYAPLQSLSDEDLDRSVDVNLKACFWLARAALPLLRKSAAGRILVTSSVSGNHANAPGLTHYSATKAGVTGFVRNLALDLAPLGITVNAVEPGFILTERNRDPAIADMVDATIAQIPMRRGGDPADIANLMAFLASSEAAYITGQSIVVDGGLTLGTASSIGAQLENS